MTPLVDPVVLETLRALGGNQLLEEVATWIRDQSALRISRLGECARRADGVGVAEVANAIRSSAGVIGAFRLERLCARVEEYGRGETDEVPTAEGLCVYARRIHVELSEVLYELEPHTA